MKIRLCDECGKTIHDDGSNDGKTVVCKSCHANPKTMRGRTERPAMASEE